MVSKNIKIPEGWESTKLNCVADIIMGQSPSSQFVSENGIGIPFLQGNAEFTAKYPQEKLWVTQPKKMSQVDDVLISVRAPVGEINMAYKDFCIGRGLSAIRFSKILKEYGWYLISFCKNQLNQVAQGSTFLAVSKKDVEELSLIFPISKVEQSKIAEILSTVDEAIDKTEALIQKYQRIKQGLMQDLLTKGIDENGNIRSEKTHKFKDSPLGRIPEEWEVNPIGKECKQSGGLIQTGPFGSQLHAKDYKENGIPIITVEHLAEGKILHQNLPLVGEADYRRLRKYVLKYGDLVFSRVGAIDRCSFTSYKEEGWLFSGRCLRVRGGSRFDAKFLSYLLNYDTCKQWILNNAVGSTMKCLNTTILSNLPIKMPTLPEQSRIASILSQADEPIQKEETYKQKLLSLKRGLMEDLLTGKVRVNHLLN